MKMQEEQKIMEFPMEFPIKVMGVNDEALLAEMNALAGGHFRELDAARTSTNLSRTGKYMSVTLVVLADSREQLDDFYRRVVAHPLVKVAL